MSGAASATLSTKAVALLAAVAVVGAAGVGGAIAGVGPTADFDVPFAQQADPAPAPETQVHLRASGSTVRVGETATYDVVVANASGGVGDHAAVVSVGDPGVASIADVSLRGNRSAEAAGVSVAADGSSANLTAGAMDPEENGSVVVATVTVSADAVGTTDVGLRVDRLDTAAGDRYNVTVASGASLAVEPNPDPAAFRVSRLNASDGVTPSEPFNVSVSVTNDGDLAATQTVRYGVDLDGDGSLGGNETAAAREVTLAAHDRETVTFAGVNVTGVDPGTHVHVAASENDSATGTVDVEAAETSISAPETAVRLLPSGAATGADGTLDAADPDDAGQTVDAGETTTYDVVVANASGGVGAQEFRVVIEDPTHATVTDVSVAGAPTDGLTEITFVDDGNSANVTAALTDTADDGTVTVATLTISGHAVGTTEIGLRGVALGTENGTAYNVTAVTGAPVTVESDYHGGSTSSSSDADDADESGGDGSTYTRDEITRAKYGVDFADLGSETAGEVQAIHNRQPLPGDTAPDDVRTRDEITNERYGQDFIDLSRQTTIDIQNDYDAQFGDGEEA